MARLPTITVTAVPRDIEVVAGVVVPISRRNS